MNEICEETRRESNEKVDKKLREEQVLEIMSDGQEWTARKIAYEMCKRGYTNNVDRNNASPRLTSLLEQRKVMIVGKEKDLLTKKMVAVYRRSNNE